MASLPTAPTDHAQPTVMGEGTKHRPIALFTKTHDVEGNQLSGFSGRIVGEM